MTTQPQYYTDMTVEPVDVWDQQGVLFAASIAMCTKYVMRNGLKSDDHHDLDGLVFFALCARYGLESARGILAGMSRNPHTRCTHEDQTLTLTRCSVDGEELGIPTRY